MKCLTNAECRKWIVSRGMQMSPYAAGILPLVQFWIKKSDSELTAIAKGIADILCKDSELLLIADDWSLYRENEMEHIMKIRKELGEDRWIIDAPGHELKKQDSEMRYKLIHFILSAQSGWSAYLYAFPSQTTLLLWEGDIIDLWSQKSGVAKKFDSFLERIKPR